jgi:hypothetical protein
MLKAMHILLAKKRKDGGKGSGDAEGDGCTLIMVVVLMKEEEEGEVGTIVFFDKAFAPALGCCAF